MKDLDRGLPLKFFHLFFPSWRFFENVGCIFQLQYRIFENENSEPAQWLELFSPLDRKWSQIFWNPTGNEYLTINNQVTRLGMSTNLKSPQSIEDLECFKLIRKYLALKLQDSAFFQFKIVAIEGFGREKLVREDIIVSSIYSQEGLI